MKLTKKQEKFATEYVKLDDASAAYRIAYSASKMKDTTVNRNAHELLKNSKIATRVAAIQSIAADVAEKEFRIDSKEILSHLNILRTSRIDQFVELIDKRVYDTDEKGKKTWSIQKSLQFKAFDNLTEEQLMCIESVKQNRYGEIELKLHGKEWTIEKIAKHIGFYQVDNEQKKPQTEISPEERDKRINELIEKHNANRK